MECSTDGADQRKTLHTLAKHMTKQPLVSVKRDDSVCCEDLSYMDLSRP